MQIISIIVWVLLGILGSFLKAVVRKNRLVYNYEYPHLFQGNRILWSKPWHEKLKIILHVLPNMLIDEKSILDHPTIQYEWLFLLYKVRDRTFIWHLWLRAELSEETTNIIWIIPTLQSLNERFEYWQRVKEPSWRHECTF